MIINVYGFTVAVAQTKYRVGIFSKPNDADQIRNSINAFNSTTRNKLPLSNWWIMQNLFLFRPAETNLYVSFGCFVKDSTEKLFKKIYDFYIYVNDLWNTPFPQKQNRFSIYFLPITYIRNPTKTLLTVIWTGAVIQYFRRLFRFRNERAKLSLVQISLTNKLLS